MISRQGAAFVPGQQVSFGSTVIACSGQASSHFMHPVQGEGQRGVLHAADARLPVHVDDVFGLVNRHDAEMDAA